MSYPSWLNSQPTAAAAASGGLDVYTPTSTIVMNSKNISIVKTMCSVINFETAVNYVAMSNLPALLANTTSNTGTPGLVFWLTPLSNASYAASASYVITATVSSNAGRGTNFGVAPFYFDLASYSAIPTQTWYLWASNYTVGTFTGATNFSYTGITTVRDGDADTTSINGSYSLTNAPMIIYGRLTEPL